MGNLCSVSQPWIGYLGALTSMDLHCQTICIKLKEKVKIHRRIKRSICAPHSMCDVKMMLHFRAR